MDSRQSAARDASRTPLKHLRITFTALCVPLLLSACRLVFVSEGQGFVVAASSQAIYRDGAVIEVDAAYSESFRPLPHPGHSFAGWGALCRNRAVDCPVTIPEQLLAFDVEGALEPRFLPGYDGPLQHTGGSIYASEPPDSGPWSISLDSLDIEGLADEDARVQVYLATRDLSFVLTGKESPGGFDFDLTESGISYQDLWIVVVALDSNGVLASVALTGETRLATDAPSLKVFRSNSPYADAVVDCVRATTVFDACNFEELPLIGMQTADPQLEDVMDRVVVTHDWMGERFSQLMQRMPGDMLRMMRGVTAVVIGANVRPAFYLPLTGAIHIDPAFIWLTNEEKATISKAADFRDGFADELSFTWQIEYLDGLFSAFQLYSLEDDQERNLAQAERLFGMVMFHELAHANDVSPPSRMATLAPTDTMVEASQANEPYSASTVLETNSPLGSELLKGAAAVRWGGKEPTETEAQLSALDAGAAFANDSAADFYGHFTVYEDAATLAEQALVKRYFGFDYLPAFVSRPTTSGNVECDDFIVGWGQYGRIGDEAVKMRAALVLQVLLGQADVTSYLADIPPPRDLEAGVGYCTSARRAILGTSSADVPVRTPIFLGPTEKAFKKLPRMMTPYQ